MIKIVEKADKSQWWQIAAADKNGTFYHTPAWADVATCMSEKYKDISIMGELNSGIKFVLPLCSFSKVWPLERIYSVYDNCYGSVIADGPVSADEYHAIFNHIKLSPFTSFDLTETPGVSFPDAPDHFSTEAFTCSLLNIGGKSFDDIFKKFAKNRRADYRLGVKKGITVRLANLDNLPLEMDHFYSVYLDTLYNRWGDGAIGHILERDFFDRLESVFKNYPDHTFLWFAELEGEPISAAINFGWNGRIDGWMMATKPGYFKIKPTTVLLTEMIRHAVENNYSIYDLGPNLENKGSEDFKRRFGAETIVYKTWHRPSPILQLIDKIRN